MPTFARVLTRTHLLAIAIAAVVVLPTLSAGAVRFVGAEAAPSAPLDRLLATVSGPVVVPLTVENTLATARTGEPVTTGVPLPRGQLADAGALWLQDPETGAPVPAQFTVTSRWNAPAEDTTASIKWVLVDVQADVPADGRRSYTLRSDGGANTAPTAPVVVDETAGATTVDTGPLRFTVPEDGSGALFDGIELDADGDGTHETTIAAPGAGVGLSLVRTDGSSYRADLDPDGGHSVEVETAGPMHVVLAVSGRHRTEAQNDFCPRDYQGCVRDQFDHLDYTIRIHAYSGKPYVRIFYSLTNPERFLEGYYNAGGERLFQEWDGLSLDFPLTTGAGPLDFTFGAEEPDDHEYPGDKLASPSAGDPTVGGRLDPTSIVELYQDSSGVENWQDSSDGFWGTTFRGYRVYRDDAVAGEGLQAAGWATVADDAWTVGVGVRHFWQNFPKGLRLGGDGLVAVDLWPRRSRDAHRFSGGRQKTHELVFGAWPGGTSQTAVADVLTGTLEPMHLLAANTHYSRTGALGPISVAPTTADPAFDRYEQTSGSMVDDPGQDVWSERFVEDLYGWRNWGDSYRGGWKADGVRYFGNNEFDLTYVNLLNYLRTPDHDRRLFDVGESQARHLYDIDVYHTGEDAIAYSHGVHKHDASGTIDHGRAPNLSHYWIRGLLDHYLLTGDRYALDAAVETGEWITNLVDASGELLFHGETRSQAWTLLALTELWETTGEERYLTMAGALAEAEIISEQSLPGANHPCADLDWEGDRGLVDKPNSAPWQNGYVAEALGRYALAVRLDGRVDAGAESALLRVLDELERCGWATPTNGRFVPGDTNRDNEVYGERYHSLVVDRLLADGDYSISFAVNQVLTDGFAYGYLFSGNDAYLAMAHETWTWTMGPERLPGTANAYPTYYATSTPAKAAGFRQRFGQTYLWLLQALDGQPPAPPTTQPPTSGPTTTQPPTSGPTTTQPPTSGPPTTQPPTSGPTTTEPLSSIPGPRPTLRPVDPGAPPSGGEVRHELDFEDGDDIDRLDPLGGSDDPTAPGRGNGGGIVEVRANNHDRPLQLLGPDGAPLLAGPDLSASARLGLAYYGSPDWGAGGPANGLLLKRLPSGAAYVVSAFPDRDGIRLRVGVTAEASAGVAAYDFLGPADGHSRFGDELVVERSFELDGRTVELGYWSLEAELTGGPTVSIVATLTSPDGQPTTITWTDTGAAAYDGPGEVGLVNHGLWSIPNRYDDVVVSSAWR